MRLTRVPDTNTILRGFCSVRIVPLRIPEPTRTICYLEASIHFCLELFPRCCVR
ncbi:hypothetical protein LEMLEM_LOCUS8803 [Lemmus lemmus]